MRHSVHLQELLTHYPSALGLETERLASGLINETYRIGQSFVLQKLHPIFAAEVNLDIAALTPRLRIKGVPVPDVVSTCHETLWVEHPAENEAKEVWRMLSLLPGKTIHRIENPKQAYEAGAILARFHTALLDCQHSFAFSRSGVHDTTKHMDNLLKALDSQTGHRLLAKVQPLAEEIHKQWKDWGPIPRLPLRIGHGDPKISNFLFDQHDAVSGVIDLDTMGWMSLDVELGDALRSWCNTATEDEPLPKFDLMRYEAAVSGYYGQTRDWLTSEELAAFPASAERICLELAARFAADALNESYFGWDPKVASTRGEHNLMRAQGQLALAKEAAKKRPQMEDILVNCTKRPIKNDLAQS